MADDLVVREWDWPISFPDIVKEHNTLARGYLAVVAERDALLVSRDDMVDQRNRFGQAAIDAREQLTASEAARGEWRRLFNEASRYLDGHELQGPARMELRSILHRAAALAEPGKVGEP